MLQSALTGEVYFPARSWNEGAVERRRCSAVFTVTSSEEPRSDSESSPLRSSPLGSARVQLLSHPAQIPLEQAAGWSCWPVTTAHSWGGGGVRHFSDMWHIAVIHTQCVLEWVVRCCPSFLFFFMLTLMPWVNKHGYLFCWDSGQVPPFSHLWRMLQ